MQWTRCKSKECPSAACLLFSTDILLSIISCLVPLHSFNSSSRLSFTTHSDDANWTVCMRKNCHRRTHERPTKKGQGRDYINLLCWLQYLHWMSRGRKKVVSIISSTPESHSMRVVTKKPSNSGIVINRHSLCPPPWKLLLSSQFLLSMHPLLGAVWAEGKVGIRGWRRLEKHHRKYNYVHKYIQIDRIQNRMHFNVQCHSWRLSSSSHLLMTTIAWRWWDLRQFEFQSELAVFLASVRLQNKRYGNFWKVLKYDCIGWGGGEGGVCWWKCTGGFYFNAVIGLKYHLFSCITSFSMEVSASLDSPLLQRFECIIHCGATWASVLYFCLNGEPAKQEKQKWWRSKFQKRIEDFYFN